MAQVGPGSGQGQARPHSLLSEWAWSGPARSQGSPGLRKPLCSLIRTRAPWPSPALGHQPTRLANASACACSHRPHRLGLLRRAQGVLRGTLGGRVSIVGDEAGGSGSPSLAQVSSLPGQSLPSTWSTAAVWRSPGKPSWGQTAGWVWQDRLTGQASLPLGCGVSRASETQLGLCSRDPNRTINLGHFPLHLG